MSNIAINVLPIFILIAVGWLAVTTRLIKIEVGEGLSDFVFRLGMPLLMFRTVAVADFSGASPWAVWLSYFSGVLIAWMGGHLIATCLFGFDQRFGVIAGVSSAFSNLVFIGLPLIDRVIGPEGVVTLSILLSIHLPVMMTTGTLLMERAARESSAPQGKRVLAVLTEVGRTLLRNPLIIALLCGSIFNFLDLPLEGLPRSVIDQLAGTAGPLALVAMGMALRKYGFSGHLDQAALFSVVKLIVMPATVLLLVRLTGLNPTWGTALVLAAAVPTGVNAYLIANHFGAGHGLASSTISLSTALGVVSVTLWAFLLGI